jgi:hypothetical protein
VTQLDPLVLQLKRHHEPIDADTLDAIASENGVRVSTVERVTLILVVLAGLALLGFAGALLVQGLSFREIVRRVGPFLYLLTMPFIVWGGLKGRRWGKIPAAMLKHFRCPHCGYDLRGLPADPVDGATVCPECGCAWRL